MNELEKASCENCPVVKEDTSGEPQTLWDLFDPERNDDGGSQE